MSLPLLLRPYKHDKVVSLQQIYFVNLEYNYHLGDYHTKYHRENKPEMFTVNKIYGNYRTGNDFFPDLKKKMKSATIGVAISSNKTSIWCDLKTFIFNVIMIKTVS